MNKNTTNRMSVSALFSAIPAMYHKHVLPSIEALVKSEWYEKVKDKQTREAVLARAEEWLIKHKDNSSVTLHLSRVVAILRRLNSQDELLSKRNILILAAVALYTVSPVDAVPDGLPLIGWLDDISLLMLALRHIAGDAAREEISINETEIQAQ